MRHIIIVEFPSNLGLKEPLPGKEPGVRNLPGWLQQNDFHRKLQPSQVLRLIAPDYSATRDPETGILNLEALAAYAQEQAALLGPVFAQPALPVIIGGDCSILLGTALALKQTGNYALFYLDGHTDFMETNLSSTGGVGGMAAAMVAGYGPAKLTQLNNRGPYLKEEYIWCVGNREYDDAYEKVIQDSRATYFSLQALRQTGIQDCVQSFLQMVAAQNLDGFWLHLDVDVLDDEVMPAVDSRTPGGLTYVEFHALLSELLASEFWKGLEITILDPDLDPTGQYTQDFVTNLVNVFRKTGKIHPVSGEVKM